MRDFPQKHTSVKAACFHITFHANKSVPSRRFETGDIKHDQEGTDGFATEDTPAMTAIDIAPAFPRSARQLIVSIAVLIVALIALSFGAPNFFRYNNIMNVLLQASRGCLDLT
jgi:hypothetical protein